MTLIAMDSTTCCGADKLLAIGVYGETVAAYRYTVLAEQAPTDHERCEFAAMADEEQEHKQRLQTLLADYYPQADFVLTAQDKEQVVSGPRLLDLRNSCGYVEVMRMILETERKTSGFYGKYSKRMTEPHLRALFEELAAEGAEHYQRLRSLAHDSGIQVE